MFNTVTPDAMSEGSPRMMIIIFLVFMRSSTLCTVMYGAIEIYAVQIY